MAAASAATSTQRVPPELVGSVAEFADPRTVMAMSAVCREWRQGIGDQRRAQAVQHIELTRRLELQYPPKLVAALRQRGIRVWELPVLAADAIPRQDYPEPSLTAMGFYRIMRFVDNWLRPGIAVHVRSQGLVAGSRIDQVWIIFPRHAPNSPLNHDHPTHLWVSHSPGELIEYELMRQHLASASHQGDRGVGSSVCCPVYESRIYDYESLLGSLLDGTNPTLRLCGAQAWTIPMGDPDVVAPRPRLRDWIA